MALAERVDLHDLAAAHVRPGGECGVNADVKAACLAAGMAAAADSVDDTDLLRHGAMETLFAGVRAPSALGSFLRSFTWGNVRQLDKAAQEFPASPAGRAPPLPGAQTLAFAGIDSTQKARLRLPQTGREVRARQGPGETLLLKGLNALAAAISTPLSAPVLGPVRLRGGNAASARGAAGLAAREAGRTGTIIARMDPASCKLRRDRRGPPRRRPVPRHRPPGTPTPDPGPGTPGHAAEPSAAGQTRPKTPRAGKQP